MNRCIPDPQRPGYDRCGQRSSTTPVNSGPLCYYCGLALRVQLDREAQKRRSRDDDDGISYHHAAAWGCLASDQ